MWENIQKLWSDCRWSCIILVRGAKNTIKYHIFRYHYHFKMLLQTSAPLRTMLGLEDILCHQV